MNFYEEDFSDELCCLCNKSKANAIFACLHVCLCMSCQKKQRGKGSILNEMFIGCPICKNQTLQIFEMSNLSSKQLLKLFGK